MGGLQRTPPGSIQRSQRRRRQPRHLDDYEVGGVGTAPSPPPVVGGVTVVHTPPGGRGRRARSRPGERPRAADFWSQPEVLPGEVVEEVGVQEEGLREVVQEAAVQEEGPGEVVQEVGVQGEGPGGEVQKWAAYSEDEGEVSTPELRRRLASLRSDSPEDPALEVAVRDEEPAPQVEEDDEAGAGQWEQEELGQEEGRGLGLVAARTGEVREEEVDQQDFAADLGTGGVENQGGREEPAGTSAREEEVRRSRAVEVGSRREEEGKDCA